MEPTVRQQPRLRRLLAALGVALVALLLCSPAQAADDILKVTVTHDDQPVVGATVLVTGDATDESATTDDSGVAEVPVPGTGVYEITVDSSGLPSGVTPPTTPLSYSKLSGGTSYAALKLDEGDAASPTASSASPSSPSSPTTATTTGTDTSGTTATGDTDETTGSFGHQFAMKMVRGTVFGLILALAAIGVSLIYGTTGLNNFAHGELVTFGGSPPTSP
jgi:Branched-chain amino acid ABC-type transport system, permease components